MKPRLILATFPIELDPDEIRVLLDHYRGVRHDAIESGELAEAETIAKRMQQLKTALGEGHDNSS